MKAPRLVAEQFALDQLARDRRHVDGDERPLAALAVIVQRARDELLAGARFARDHHRQIGLRQPRDACGRFPASRGERPIERERSSLLLCLGALAAALAGESAADDRDQLLQIERLWQIFVSAALRRRDRGEDSVLRAHHHDRKIGTHPLDARQQIEGVLVGQHHIGDDDDRPRLPPPSARASPH